MRSKLFSVLLILTAVSVPTMARAEFFYITPIIGLEWINQGSASVSKSGVDTSSAKGVGLALGGHAGFALGPLRLGALYQRAFVLDDAGLHFDKLYAEVGIAPRFGFVGLMFTLAGGYAFFGSQTIGIAHGAGGRATAAVDFYMGDHFSLGPEVSFDAAAYFPSGSTAVATYGVTGALRVGIHL